MCLPDMAAFCIVYILLLSTQGDSLSNGGDYGNKKQGFDPCYVSVCTDIIVQVCVSWIFRGIAGYLALEKVWYEGLGSNPC